MFDRDRIFVISAAALCTLYTLVRFWGIADSCLWFDEIFGVHAAEHPFGEMVWFVAQDLIHPPLFYVLLKGWISIGGESIFWLRSLSVLFAIAALAPFLLLCKELKLSFEMRIIALAFFTVNGSLIKYTQEVRMYSLLLFLAIASTWIFTRFFFRGKNIWILTLINLLLVYTHYYGWLVVGGEIAAILIFQRMKLRHVLTMLAILIAAHVPWIWAIAQAASSGADVYQNIGWIQPPGVTALIDLAFDIIEPFYFQETSIAATTTALITVPLLLLIVAAFALFFANWKSFDGKQVFKLLAVVAAAPFALAFIASWISPVSVWGSRHLIVIFPAALILAAIAIDAVKETTLKAILIAAVVFLFCVAFVFRIVADRQEHIWCAWEKHARGMPTDVPQKVFVFEDLVAYHFWFATRGNANVEVIKVNGLTGMDEDKAYFLPRGFNKVTTAGPGEMSGAKFWIAFRDIQLNANHPPINVLREQQYSVGESKIIDALGSKAILVEMSR